MKILSLLPIVATVLVPYLQISLGSDSISLSQSITDGMTIVSEDKTFELGFFSPGNSKKRYVGIWYYNIPKTVVWVANRVSPINGSSGILKINSTGNLVLTQNDTVVWYSTSQKQAKSPIAQLLDSGNFVVRDENEENSQGYLWESFDYPFDTLLPGMKYGWDLRTGLNRIFTNWKSLDDPAPGDVSSGFKLNRYPETYVKVGEKYYRGGPWNGLSCSGFPQARSNTIYGFIYVSNENEFYVTINTNNKSARTRIVFNETTYRSLWVESEKAWKSDMAFPMDYCDSYGLCGKYGTCVITDNPVCKCLKGFKPKSPQDWDSLDWSQGCVRNTPLGCVNNSKDGFIKLESLKLPDTTNTFLDEKIGLEECRIKCLNNCSCMAYANSDIRGTGSGCVMWLGDLMDIREFTSGGQDLYIRIAASEIGVESGHKKKLHIIVATVSSAILGMLLFGSYYIYKVRRNMTVKSEDIEVDQNNDEEDLDLPLFDLSTIATATDNFSSMNKIGEGGFGPVYKGKFINGQEIAVKRLSESSKQGMIEFKNEVKLIAKLQHRNLVRLLGFCMQGNEKMLVYEYMPNASLDSFIFDDTRGKLLDWPKRFNIICGIARGLLYLHQDSRLKIIHRDLKTSNVLLDKKLNAKISDFGMAKTFREDQIEGNTKHIVGTFGYMAPEYTANGKFSVKSDVFSFGILLLEIICGKRNKGLYHPDDDLNLISHAWKMWKEDKALELVDKNIKNTWIESEVLRCIHVSLLCVQQFPNDRPTMSSVVPMLGGENELVDPKLPSFFPRRGIAEANSSSSQKETVSINKVTISMLEAR